MNPDTPNTPDLLGTMRTAIDDTLKSSIQQWLNDPDTGELVSMVNHHFGWDTADRSASGKRIRPLLTLLCCQAAGGEWENALPAACAVETIHNFSLVHDDIQDKSATRRGRPTLWANWGTAQSINTGDTLFILAHLFLYEQQLNAPAPVALEAARILDRACLELTYGQHLDLSFENRQHVTPEEYMRMIQGKTSSLLAASCRLGAVIACADEALSARYSAYGLHLGTAFQLLDDILGIWGSESTTGKPAGQDILSREKTFPVLLGLQDSADFARIWQKESLKSADLDEMLQALAVSGVKEHTLKVAELQTQLAMRELELSEATPSLKTILTDLALSLLRRES